MLFPRPVSIVACWRAGLRLESRPPGCGEAYEKAFAAAVSAAVSRGDVSAVERAARVADGDRRLEAILAAAVARAPPGVLVKLARALPSELRRLVAGLVFIRLVRREAERLRERLRRLGEAGECLSLLASGRFREAASCAEKLYRRAAVRRLLDSVVRLPNGRRLRLGDLLRDIAAAATAAERAVEAVERGDLRGAAEALESARGVFEELGVWGEVQRLVDAALKTAAGIAAVRECLAGIHEKGYGWAAECLRRLAGELRGVEAVLGGRRVDLGRLAEELSAALSALDKAFKKASRGDLRGALEILEAAGKALDEYLEGGRGAAEAAVRARYAIAMARRALELFRHGDFKGAAEAAEEGLEAAPEGVRISVAGRALPLREYLASLHRAAVTLAEARQLVERDRYEEAAELIEKHRRDFEAIGVDPGRLLDALAAARVLAEAWEAAGRVARLLSRGDEDSARRAAGEAARLLREAAERLQRLGLGKAAGEALEAARVFELVSHGDWRGVAGLAFGDRADKLAGFLAAVATLANAYRLAVSVLRSAAELLRKPGGLDAAREKLCLALATARGAERNAEAVGLQGLASRARSLAAALEALDGLLGLAAAIGEAVTARDLSLDERIGLLRRIRKRLAGMRVPGLAARLRDALMRAVDRILAVLGRVEKLRRIASGMLRLGEEIARYIEEEHPSSVDAKLLGMYDKLLSLYGDALKLDRDYAINELFPVLEYVKKRAAEYSRALADAFTRLEERHGVYIGYPREAGIAEAVRRLRDWLRDESRQMESARKLLGLPVGATGGAAEFIAGCAAGALDYLGGFLDPDTWLYMARVLAGGFREFLDDLGKGRVLEALGLPAGFAAEIAKGLARELGEALRSPEKAGELTAVMLLPLVLGDALYRIPVVQRIPVLRRLVTALVFQDVTAPAFDLVGETLETVLERSLARIGDRLVSSLGEGLEKALSVLGKPGEETAAAEAAKKLLRILEDSTSRALEKLGVFSGLEEAARSLMQRLSPEERRLLEELGFEAGDLALLPLYRDEIAEALRELGRARSPEEAMRAAEEAQARLERIERIAGALRRAGELLHDEKLREAAEEALRRITGVRGGLRELLESGEEILAELTRRAREAFEELFEKEATREAKRTAELLREAARGAGGDLGRCFEELAGMVEELASARAASRELLSRIERRAAELRTRAAREAGEILREAGDLLAGLLGGEEASRAVSAVREALRERGLRGLADVLKELAGETGDEALKKLAERAEELAGALEAAEEALEAYRAYMERVERLSEKAAERAEKELKPLLEEARRGRLRLTREARRLLRTLDRLAGLAARSPGLRRVLARLLEVEKRVEAVVEPLARMLGVEEGTPYREVFEAAERLREIAGARELLEKALPGEKAIEAVRAAEEGDVERLAEILGSARRGAAEAAERIGRHDIAEAIRRARNAWELFEAYKVLGEALEAAEKEARARLGELLRRLGLGEVAGRLEKLPAREAYREALEALEERAGLRGLLEAAVWAPPGLRRGIEEALREGRFAVVLPDGRRETLAEILSKETVSPDELLAVKRLRDTLREWLGKEKEAAAVREAAERLLGRLDEFLKGKRRIRLTGLEETLAGILEAHGLPRELREALERLRGPLTPSELLDTLRVLKRYAPVLAARLEESAVLRLAEKLLGYLRELREADVVSEEEYREAADTLRKVHRIVLSRRGAPVVLVEEERAVGLANEVRRLVDQLADYIESRGGPEAERLSSLLRERAGRVAEELRSGYLDPRDALALAEVLHRAAVKGLLPGPGRYIVYKLLEVFTPLAARATGGGAGEALARAAELLKETRRLVEQLPGDYVVARDIVSVAGIEAYVPRDLEERIREALRSPRKTWEARIGGLGARLERDIVLRDGLYRLEYRLEIPLPGGRRIKAILRVDTRRLAGGKALVHTAFILDPPAEELRRMAERGLLTEEAFKEIMEVLGDKDRLLGLIKRLDPDYSVLSRVVLRTRSGLVGLGRLLAATAAGAAARIAAQVFAGWVRVVPGQAPTVGTLPVPRSLAEAARSAGVEPLGLLPVKAEEPVLLGLVEDASRATRVVRLRLPWGGSVEALDFQLPGGRRVLVVPRNTVKLPAPLPPVHETATAEKPPRPQRPAPTLPIPAEAAGLPELLGGLEKRLSSGLLVTVLERLAPGHPSTPEHPPPLPPLPPITPGILEKLLQELREAVKIGGLTEAMEKQPRAPVPALPAAPPAGLLRRLLTELESAVLLPELSTMLEEKATATAARRKAVEQAWETAPVAEWRTGLYEAPLRIPRGPAYRLQQGQAAARVPTPMLRLPPPPQTSTAVQYTYPATRASYQAAREKTLPLYSYNELYAPPTPGAGGRPPGAGQSGLGAGAAALPAAPPAVQLAAGGGGGGGEHHMYEELWL